jgi:hypothetical protein
MYTCNGRFNLSMKRGEVLQNLLTSCAGKLTYVSGQFYIWPAAWYGTTPTSFSNAWMLSNSAGPFRWRPTVSISNRYNAVKGTYVSPVNNWQSADFPYYAQDAQHGYNNGPAEYDYDQNLANDNGDRRYKDIQLPFTISCSMAQRIAKIELMRTIWQGTGTFMLNMAGYQIAPLDIIQMSLSYFGWTSKYLEVAAARLKCDKQQQDGGSEITLLGTEIDVQETDPSVYEWAVIEQLSPAGYQYPGVPDAIFTPAPPTNLMFSFDENGHPILTWTASADGYVLNGGSYIARYMLVASPPGLWISLGTFAPTVTQLTMPSLLPGQMYIVELAAVNAAGVPSAWVSINYTPLSLPPQWAPYAIQAASNDALFPNEWSFSVALSYTNLMGGASALADGSALARINVTGVQPINQTIANCPPAVITAATVSSTGGYIPGGLLLYVSATADDGNGNYSPPAAIFQVQIPTGTNTNSVSLSVTWPSYSGFVHYQIYASWLVDLICAQQGGTLTAATISSPPAANPYTPGTVTLGGESSPPNTALARSTFGLPNSKLRKIRLHGQIAYHCGVLGAGVTSVSGNILESTDCIDPTGQDNWVGRVLVIIGRDNLNTFPAETVPFTAYNITGFVAATGQFTLDRSAASSPPGPNDVQVGDAFAVCTLGYNNSANPYELQDLGWSNATNYNFQTHASTPHSGLTPNLERNMVAWVIKGTSRGQQATVVANTTNTHILDTPLVIDSTSVWIIVEAGSPYSMDSQAIQASDPAHPTTIVLPVSNFSQQSMILVPTLVDLTGAESEYGDGPLRMFYAYGNPGTNVAVQPGYNTLVIVSNQVTIDLGLGLSQLLVINQTTQIIVDNPISSGTPISPSSSTGKFTLYMLTNLVSGHATTPNFGQSGSNFGTDVRAITIGPSNGSLSSLVLQYHQLPTDSGPMWHVVSFTQGF